MKINEVLNESFADETPNITVQFKKAMDVGGNYPILFKDGSKVKIPVNMIIDFLNKYDQLKPMQRNEMQKLAVMSPDKFKEVLASFKGDRPEKSIY